MRTLLVLLAACTHASSPHGPSSDAITPATDAAESDASAQLAGGWRSQVLYLVIPDRYRNGDPSNDNATGCFDPTQPRKFHGGALAGLRAYLPLLQALGVPAQRSTPPSKQAGPASTTACGYHGYWID